MRVSLLLMPLSLAVLLAAAPLPAGAEDGVPPVPRFDAIDYARPDAHLGLSPRVGEEARLRSLAGQLRGEQPADTLAAIHRWLARNLRYDASKAPRRWRTLDEMLKERSYGSCADHAVLFGTFARAAGIPTVWVKSMDVDWIEDFRAGRPSARDYRGRVFLEVFVGGRWHLLDARAGKLYEGPYAPRTARLLPGHRFAYDKGGDPYALVLSCRWDLWKKQTDAYFSRLDMGLLPWGRARDLLARWRVWIAGCGSTYRYAEQACKRLGYHVESAARADLRVTLAQARGHILIVTCPARRPALPEAEWPRWLPPGWQGVVRGDSPPKDGYLAHRLADGTRVILVPGQDLTAVQIGVARGLSAPP